MPNITLSMPKELYKEMKEHPEIRWSRIARNAIAERIKVLKLLDEFANKLNLSSEEAEELDEIVKFGVWKRCKELMR